MLGTDNYAGARPLRKFECHGFQFTVVRWRDAEGKHWRKYTTLLFNGRWASDDISRNKTDEDETWEAEVLRRFPTKEKLEEALKSFGLVV